MLVDQNIRYARTVTTVGVLDDFIFPNHITLSEEEITRQIREHVRRTMQFFIKEFPSTTFWKTWKEKQYRLGKCATCEFKQTCPDSLAG